MKSTPAVLSLEEASRALLECQSQIQVLLETTANQSKQISKLQETVRKQQLKIDKLEKRFGKESA